MKSSAILKFLLSTLLFAAITGCSSDKSPKNLYLYEGIERFGVKHCNDTLLVIAYYGVGEKDTMTLYPKNGGYYRRRVAFGEQLILAVKDFPQDTVYYHKSAKDFPGERVTIAAKENGHFTSCIYSFYSKFQDRKHLGISRHEILSEKQDWRKPGFRKKRDTKNAATRKRDSQPHRTAKQFA